MQGSTRHAGPAVKGKGPVPSTWLISVVISCLLATHAVSLYCDTGQGPAAYWISAGGTEHGGEPKLTGL